MNHNRYDHDIFEDLFFIISRRAKNGVGTDIITFKGLSDNPTEYARSDGSYCNTTIYVEMIELSDRHPNPDDGKAIVKSAAYYEYRNPMTPENPSGMSVKYFVDRMIPLAAKAGMMLPRLEMNYYGYGHRNECFECSAIMYSAKALKASNMTDCFYESPYNWRITVDLCLSENRGSRPFYGIPYSRFTIFESADYLCDRIPEMETFAQNNPNGFGSITKAMFSISFNQILKSIADFDKATADSMLVKSRLG